MPVYVYWNIRGLAQPARLLLNYVGDEFEDKLYECGPAPDYNKDCWISVKETFGLDFPNLPYYIDGDIKITQSNAILRHIGRKHDLCGSTEAEKVAVDIMLDQAMDFRNAFVYLCYNPKFEDLKADYIKNLPTILNRFEKFLGNKKFFIGDKVTIVDFPMYEMLDQNRQLLPDLLRDYPGMKSFMDRFEALPAIKAYMESDKFMKAPLNNKMAKFGAV